MAPTRPRRCRSAPASSASTRWRRSRRCSPDRRSRVGAVVGPLDGRDRGDPRRGRRPARRRGRRDLRPGRSATAHPPDVPPGQPADPRLRSPIPLAWLTTRVYLAAARPSRPGRVGDRGHRALPRDRSCWPTATRTTRSCRSTHLDRLAAAARAAAPATRTRPVETLVVAGGQHSWLYEFPAYRAAVAGFLARPSADRSTRTRPAAIAAATTGRAAPRRRAAVRRRRDDAGRPPHARRGRAPGALRPTPGPATRRRPRSHHDRPTDRSRSGGRSRIARAVRSFEDRPLDDAHLERILHAGRRAASSKNQQRWAFIVCRDRDHLGRCRRSDRSRRTSPARPSGSPSSPRTRRPPTRRCRSCSTSARRPTR